jgi:hypothetical protein
MAITAPTPQSPAPATADALPALSPNTPNSSAKSEAGRLQPTGRLSLSVDFPTEGQVYHFEKIKANAQLDLTVTKPGVFVRWRNLAIFLLLAGAFYAVGRFFERRAGARTPRTAAAQ